MIKTIFEYGRKGKRTGGFVQQLEWPWPLELSNKNPPHELQNKLFKLPHLQKQRPSITIKYITDYPTGWSRSLRSLI